MITINLLPWREQERQAKKKRCYWMAGFYAITMAICLLGTNHYLKNNIQHARERIAYLNQHLDELKEQSQAVDKLLEKKKQTLARMEIIQSLQTKRAEIVRLFDELVQIVPQGIYFTTLNYNNGTIELNGVTESNAQVSSFMRKVEASTIFTNPNLSYISKGKNNIATFHMTILHQPLIAEDENYG